MTSSGATNVNEPVKRLPCFRPSPPQYAVEWKEEEENKGCWCESSDPSKRYGSEICDRFLTKKLSMFKLSCRGSARAACDGAVTAATIPTHPTPTKALAEPDIKKVRRSTWSDRVVVVVVEGLRCGGDGGAKATTQWPTKSVVMVSNNRFFISV
jgi:hypothetical protein